MTRKITQPLGSLMKGAEQIGKGDLETRIPVLSSDEFGRLSKVFNNMASQLQETLTTLQYREEHFRSIFENSGALEKIISSESILLANTP